MPDGRDAAYFAALVVEPRSEDAAAAAAGVVGSTPNVLKLEYCAADLIGVVDPEAGEATANVELVLCEGAGASASVESLDAEASAVTDLGLVVAAAVAAATLVV